MNFDVEIYEKKRPLATAMYCGHAMKGGIVHKLGIIECESHSDDYLSVRDPVERATWLLEMTGAGLFRSEKTYAKEHGHKVAYNIGEGSIYISPSGMELCRNSAQKRVVVVLDDIGEIINTYTTSNSQ